MKALTVFAFCALVAGVVGFGLTSLLNALPSPPVPVKPPLAIVCVTDSEVLTPPKGTDGMRLKTTMTCREAK